jgi:hypothetical protein
VLTLVAGLAPEGTESVTVDPTDGAPVAAEIVRSGSGAWFVARLPGGAGIDRIRVTTADGQVVADLGAPPPVPRGAGVDIAKGPPPGPALQYEVLRDGRALPGNEWRVAAAPEGRLTVRTSPTGAAHACLLTFVLLSADDGGTPVERVIPQAPVRDDGRTFDLTWDGTAANGDPVPAGEHRLVARTEEQAEPCDGGDAPRAQVEVSLGYLVVPG